MKTQHIGIGAFIVIATSVALVLFTPKNKVPCINCETVIVQCQHQNPKLCDALTRGMAMLDLRVANGEEQRYQEAPILKVDNFRGSLNFFALSWEDDGKVNTRWTGMHDLDESSPEFSEFMASEIAKVRDGVAKW